MTSRLLVYAIALLLGVETVSLVLPLATLVGAGGGWNPPGPDQAQALTGHIAFQADAWRWPLLDTQRLFWPHGISIALTDSNPLFSLLAKVWTHATGGAPINALGAFLGVCWLLQPVAAVYAARGLHTGLLASLVAGVLAAAWPALMVRMGHLNLCAHFLILLALGLAVRRIERRGGWTAPAGLLVLAVLIHPYLFQLCAVVLAAIPLSAALRRRAGWRRDGVLYLLSGILAVGVLSVLSGPIGGGDKGFTFFSMNLISPVWPQMSGVFGANLPVIDATGGQYEGFNWLGAGVMLLLLATLVMAAVRRAWPRPALGLVIVLGCLVIISLSSRVYAGQVKLLDLGTKPWEDLFGSFRSSGRAFWPVGYAVMLAVVASADRMPRAIGGPLLLAAALLQVADIRPLLGGARGAWETGLALAAPTVPAGTTLFTVAPFPGCAPEAATKRRGPLMILDAVRHGARVGDVGLGRSPKWFSCELILSDALELPLAPGETRAFFERGPQAALRPALLGAGAVCRGDGDVVICGRDVASFAGAPVATGTPPAALALPLTLEGGGIAAVLGSNWTLTPSGEAWSEGPRATLLIPVTAGRALTLTLHATGVATDRGGVRAVAASIGRDAATTFSLADGSTADIAIAVPAAATADGMVRVALDTVRPVDPTKRGMTAPVQRAAIRLTGLSLRAE